MLYMKLINRNIRWIPYENYKIRKKYVDNKELSNMLITHALVYRATFRKLKNKENWTIKNLSNFLIENVFFLGLKDELGPAINIE